MIFILKQYDFELLTFDLCQDGLDGVACSILSVNEVKRHLLPLGMPLNGDGLLSWLKSRIIPRNREYVDKIFSVYGLSRNNLLGIIKLCFGLSLNDSYWCVPEGFNGRFSEFNLYENTFNKALSLIAYTGFGSVRPSGYLQKDLFEYNIRLLASLAQLVEHLICNQRVVGSSPTTGTIRFRLRYSETGPAKQGAGEDIELEKRMSRCNERSE